MAWQVYGAMHGRDADAKRRVAAIYGPLPRKRWIAMPGERKHRVKAFGLVWDYHHARRSRQRDRVQVDDVLC